MYEKYIRSIQAEGSRLVAAQQTAIQTLQNLEDEDGNVINISMPIDDADRTTADLDTLTSSLVKFVEGFREDKNWAFVPKSWIIEFHDALKNTANSFDNLSNNLEAIDGQFGGLASIDPATFSAATQSGTAIDFKKLLNSISVNIDSSFAAYFQLRPAISAPRLTEFGDLFGFFSSRRSELDNLSRELSRLEKQAKSSAEATESAASATDEAQKEISKLSSDATKLHASLKAAATETESQIETIEAAKDSAEELSQTVAAYRNSFEKFQTEMNARNADYSAKKKAYEELKSRLDAEHQRIEEISLQAEDMLKGATNAGLAGSYSKKQINVEDEIRTARITYYISIGLLVFLTLPIFIYSFPREYVAEIFKQLFGFDAPLILTKDASQSEYQHVFNFIGRAVFLIPGLMFVRFASTRHAQLFRLREDYAYKYSIASSVDGFMKQAKEYADDIAAASYYELTYNPTEHMDGKGDDARLMNPIFERMLARLEAKMVKKRPKPIAG